MKIFVAIPVYDGKLHTLVAKCLFEELTVANELGDKIQVGFMPYCAVPAQGRNQLVQMFLESDCDKLFFLDADVTFQPGSIVKLCHMPEDFVGACYRFKKQDECYPMDFLPGERWANKFGLMEVAMLPTGFLSLSRDVFKKLKDARPERNYEHWGHREFCYFEMIFKEGALHSDDAGFCKDWRAIGGKIFVYPEMALGHLDFAPTAFVGNVGYWLREKMKDEQPGG